MTIIIIKKIKQNKEKESKIKKEGKCFTTYLLISSLAKCVSELMSELLMTRAVPSPFLFLTKNQQFYRENFLRVDLLLLNCARLKMKTNTHEKKTKQSARSPHGGSVFITGSFFLLLLLKNTRISFSPSWRVLLIYSPFLEKLFINEKLCRWKQKTSLLWSDRPTTVEGAWNLLVISASIFIVH